MLIRTFFRRSIPVTLMLALSACGGGGNYYAQNVSTEYSCQLFG